MKLTDNQLPAAQTSGDMVTLNMGISDNAEDQLMILNVLSASLYTDKPAAVLREYACNAFDANVEAGKGDVPIEVCLPNKLEPSLRIRDFGFGMSEEQIANTFVMLGRSTKRSSNAFTGMLGIGSKSGFAYGDSFMVTSFTGGRKVVYNAFRDKGAPRLAKMLGPVPTSEPDGIEIKVPVRIEHFEEFRQKAERIYRYFKVRPIIKGARVDFQDAARLMSGTGWHYTGIGKSIAIMGNVGYDLNYAAMGPGTLDHKAGTLIQLGVELEFAIGDLEITASREGLQYKDITKRAVIDRIKVMVDEVGKSFTGQIASAACMWDARRIYGELFERLGQSNTRSLKEVVDGHVKWNGQVINTGRVNLENKEASPGIRITRVQRNKWATHRLDKDMQARECYASKDVALVINDLPGGHYSPSREKGFFDANPTMTGWVVFTFPDAPTQAKYWLARGLDGAPTINLSSVTPAVTLVVPGAAPRVHNSKHSAKAFVLDEAYTPIPSYYVGRQSDYWNQESVNLKKDKGAYVVLDAFYVGMADNYDLDSSNEFQLKVTALREAGLITGPVYGFKRAVMEANRLGPGWVPLKDAISARLEELIAKKGLLQEAADFISAIEFPVPIDPAHAKLFPKLSKVRYLLDKVNVMRKPSASKAAMELVLRATNVKPWLAVPALPTASFDLSAAARDMHNEYPLLGYIQSLALIGDQRIKAVADYVAMVDNA